MEKKNKNSDTKSPSFEPVSTKKETEVMYVKIKKDNKTYLTKAAVEANISLNEYMDQLIDTLRESNYI